MGGIGILMFIGGFLLALVKFFNNYTKLALILLVLGGFPLVIAVELYGMFGKKTWWLIWGGFILAMIGMPSS